MKPRWRTIRLRTGDVRELRIYHNAHMTRLVIYDEDRAVPLIQALLDVPEREALRRSLGPGK
jgi:hypothetical protein